MRVMLNRGRRDVGPPVFSSGSRWLGRVKGVLALLLSLLLVPEEPVVDGASGPLISVVDSGAVLVMVAVVVVVDV